MSGRLDVSWIMLCSFEIDGWQETGVRRVAALAQETYRGRDKELVVLKSEISNELDPSFWRRSIRLLQVSVPHGPVHATAISSFL